MDSSRSRDSSEPPPPIDPAQPFKGVVVCCTSIPPDQRAEIAKKTSELGGIHKYDLTPDVTHLVVGDYDTPKYRHVAKERNDIKAMDAGWIDAVGQLWMDDADIDFAALEREWQLKPLETCGEVVDAADETGNKRGSLLLCMTGFDDPGLRNGIIEKIVANGGTYTGDLTKRVSHLIVFKPEGKKYKAARSWNIRTVSLAWLEQSIERGMILDEQCFDPVLPPEEQGQGAWSRSNPKRASLGKRSRSSVGEDGQRKLRKTASMKLSSQRDNLWGDILGSKPAAESSAPGSRSERIEVQDSGVHDAIVQQQQHQPSPDAGIFSTCYFFMVGFEARESKILAEAISSLGGFPCDSFEEMFLETGGTRSSHKFVIVPQESQPSTHFQVPPTHVDEIQIVTEFFIERCLHKKELCGPDSHVLGRPFPMFPIPGFEGLSICTAGFTGIDLLHVGKSIRQIGAKYAERLNETTAVLVCKSLAETRKEKLKLALDNDIPIVSSEWLWECISTGYNVPVRGFMFPELKQNPALKPKPRAKEQQQPKDQHQQQKQPIQRTLSEPIPHMPKKPASRHTSVAGGIDPSAFQNDSKRELTEPKRTVTREDSAASFQFQTAKTHQVDSFGGGSVAAPLSNASTNALNKWPPSQRGAKPAAEKTRSVSVADSTAPTPTPFEGPSTTAGENNDDDENTPVPITKASHGDTDTATMAAAAETDDQEAELKRQRDAQKAAEKEAISSKLASLIESTTTTTTTTTTSTGAETGHEDEESSGNQQQQQQQQQQQRRPRKNRIMGRAISNASAASSGSADSLGRQADDHHHHHQLDLHEPDQEPKADPPLTQIQYQDPGAQQHRAKILSKMRGSGGGGDLPAAAVGQPGKIKIGGFEFEDGAGGVGRLSSRRQTRRNI